MALPVYFLLPNLFGWYAGENGALISPKAVVPGELLIFDDRNALPEDTGRLIGALNEAMKKTGAKTLLLDFERPPSPAAEHLIEKLAKKHPTVAPEQYEGGADFTPLMCYDPGRELFAEFRRRIIPGSWLELRPVDRLIRFPAETGGTRMETDTFSEELQCRYRMETAEDGYTLRLYDTSETFRDRFALLSPGFAAAIGLKHELDAIVFTI